MNTTPHVPVEPHTGSAHHAWSAAIKAAAHDDEAGWVRAEPFRAHVRCVLAETGLHWRVLATGAGVPPLVVRTLLFGRRERACRRIRAMDAASLLLFTPATVRRLAMTPAAPSSIDAAVRALLRAGCSVDQVAAWLRMSPARLVRLANGLDAANALVIVQLAAICTAHGLEGVRGAPPVTHGWSEPATHGAVECSSSGRAGSTPLALHGRGTSPRTPEASLPDLAA